MADELACMNTPRKGRPTIAQLSAKSGNSEFADYKSQTVDYRQIRMKWNSAVNNLLCTVEGDSWDGHTRETRCIIAFHKPQQSL